MHIYAKSANMWKGFKLQLQNHSTVHKMAKSGNKNRTKASKDKVKEKSGTGAIVKAKDKRKKATAFKKVWF